VKHPETPETAETLETLKQLGCAIVGSKGVTKCGTYHNCFTI
jgi:hypothetical protein